MSLSFSGVRLARAESTAVFTALNESTSFTSLSTLAATLGSRSGRMLDRAFPAVSTAATTSEILSSSWSTFDVMVAALRSAMSMCSGCEPLIVAVEVPAVKVESSGWSIVPVTAVRSRRSFAPPSALTVTFPKPVAEREGVAARAAVQRDRPAAREVRDREGLAARAAVQGDRLDVRERDVATADLKVGTAQRHVLRARDDDRVGARPALDRQQVRVCADVADRDRVVATGEVDRQRVRRRRRDVGCLETGRVSV